MRWVVDASVAAKWLAPEPESANASALLDDELAAPDLLFAEVGNILFKKQLRAEMDPATAQLAARWLLHVPMAVYDSAGLLDEALALALRLQHPAYDCFYLALAQRIDAPLVTADRRLHARCMAADAVGIDVELRLLTKS
jgi:predicted nucleic acid-binding protein